MAVALWEDLFILGMLLNCFGIVAHPPTRTTFGVVMLEWGLVRLRILSVSLPSFATNRF